MNNKKILSYIIITVFLGTIGWYTVFNFNIITSTLNSAMNHNITIKKMKSDVNKSFKSDNLFLKDNFINLSGLYGRISGRRLYNNVVLLNNGMLTTVPYELKDIDMRIQNLTELKNFIEARNSRFMYVQFPFKVDMEKKLLPTGYKLDIEDEIEALLDNFRENGIDVIDTIPALSKTAADIDENYYRTDHHWKPTAAFKAFQIVSNHLRDVYPEESFPEKIQNIDNWTVHEIPDIFLGSWGKRVGEYFAEADDLLWLTPDFRTELSFYIPNLRRFVFGNYEDAFLWKEYTEAGANKLHTNNYCIYLGSNYPLVNMKNPLAASDLKLMIISDSYTRPVMTFLSLYFREIDMIDPRLYTETSLKEYIDRTDHDLVMMAIHTNCVQNDLFFDYENDDDLYRGDSYSLVFDSGKEPLIIRKSSSDYNYASIYNSFENERIYTLKLPRIEITDGDTNSLSIMMYDQRSKKKLWESMYDINYCNSNGNCEWTFETPESGSKYLELRIYSGVVSKTKNIGAVLYGCGLLKWDNVQ